MTCKAQSDFNSTVNFVLWLFMTRLWPVSRSGQFSGQWSVWNEWWRNVWVMFVVKQAEISMTDSK